MVMIDCAGAGDIVSIAGLTTPSIGHTVANAEVFFLHSISIQSCSKLSVFENFLFIFNFTFNFV